MRKVKEMSMKVEDYYVSLIIDSKQRKELKTGKKEENQAYLYCETTKYILNNN